MKRIFVILLLLPVGLSAETVYKSVDKDGSISFSDQPSANSEKLEINKAPAVNFRKIEMPARPAQQASKGKGEYQSLAIQQPSNEATVRDNQGNVTVDIGVLPALDKGHVIALEMDGKKLGETSGATFKLKKIERGAHQLLARIIDQEGNVLLSSDPVTFYLHKTSKLTGPLSDKGDAITPLNPPTVNPGGTKPTQLPESGNTNKNPAPTPRL